jgi:hypothetical protein
MELIKLITHRPTLESFNKYENGQIYAIICKTTNKIYIGSTILSLRERLKQHINAYNRYHKKKAGYCYCNEIIKNNNYSILRIKKYPCNNRLELQEEEKKWIEHFKHDIVNKYLIYDL